jgi:hypothetical protein
MKMIRRVSLQKRLGVLPTARDFRAKPQGFEFLRCFETPLDCHIRAKARNKFTNCLSLAAVEPNFQTTRYRYADK